MQRYDVSQFDNDTFVVIDNYENREICVCGNFNEVEDAGERARKIVFLLNRQIKMQLHHKQPEQ